MRIYIIGFMGSGKTIFGKRLAAYSDFDFLDLDACFEEKYHIDILDFFTSHTEVEFRKIESNLLRQTIYRDRLVISLGGGTPCFHNNMEWLLKAGLCVYLQLSPKALHNSLLHSKKKRPLIIDKSPDELLQYIKITVAEREKFYNQAHLVIPGINLKANPIEQTFQMIMEKIG